MNIIKKLLLKIYKSLVKVFTGYGLIKVYPIRALHTLISSRLVSSFSIVDGHKMFLDSQDSLDLSFGGVYEPFEIEAIKKELSSGDVVLDIGANIGYHTLIFAKCVGSKGKVFAFEPDPENFSLLKKNIKWNSYRNVVLIPKAVSDRNGKINLYLSENNKADHRIYDSKDKRKHIEIVTIKLDDYFSPRKKGINFIKMDIQGAELLALKGMQNLLSRNRKIKLVTEFWPIGIKRCGGKPEGYLKLLRKLNFKIYHLDDIKNQIKLISDSELLEKYPVDGEGFTNLLCIKS